MLGNISEISTKAPCEAALMDERHMRIEISDFVMRAFVPIQRKDSSHAVFFHFGNVSTFRKDGFLRSSMRHRRKDGFVSSKTRIMQQRNIALAFLVHRVKLSRNCAGIVL